MMVGMAALTATQINLILYRSGQRLLERDPAPLTEADVERVREVAQIAADVFALLGQDQPSAVDWPSRDRSPPGSIVLKFDGGPAAAVCHGCEGARVILNNAGTMVPAPDWTGPLKPRAFDRTRAIHPGEAIACPACVPLGADEGALAPGSIVLPE